MAVGVTAGILAAMAILLLPLSDGSGQSCGNVFTARTAPTGTRFNSVGPHGICAQRQVRSRESEGVAVGVAATIVVGVGAGVGLARRHSRKPQ
jgi:hypothetical protein